MIFPPHEKTIRQYLGLPRESQLIPDRFEYIEKWGICDLMSGAVLGVNKDEIFELKNARVTAPQGIEFRYYRKNAIGAAFDEKSKNPVGFISMGTPVCIRQREGIGSHLVAYFDPIYPHYTRTYSEAGYYNRIAAHALLVTWACLDGLSVPQEVLDEYCVYKDRLKLRERIDSSTRFISAERIVELFQ